MPKRTRVVAADGKTTVHAYAWREAPPQPEDAINGEWPRNRLLSMNKKFAAAMAREERMPDLKRLTGFQLKSVLVAAQQLRQGARSPFYELVAEALNKCDDAGDCDVDRAIRAALGELHLERRVTL